MIRAIQSIALAQLVYRAIYDGEPKHAEGTFVPEVERLVYTAAGAHPSAILAAFRLFDLLVEDTRRPIGGLWPGRERVRGWRLERAASAYYAEILDCDAEIIGKDGCLRAYPTPQRALLAAILRAWIELYVQIERGG